MLRFFFYNIGKQKRRKDVSRKSRRPFMRAVFMLLMAILAICLGIFTAKWLTSPLLNADKTESIPMDEIVEDKGIIVCQYVKAIIFQKKQKD